MRKQLYNTDMRSSCRLSHKDGQQHVLSPPDRKVAENTLTAPNSKYVNLKSASYLKSSPRYELGWSRDQPSSYPVNTFELIFSVYYLYMKKGKSIRIILKHNRVFVYNNANIKQ